MNDEATNEVADNEICKAIVAEICEKLKENSLDAKLIADDGLTIYIDNPDFITHWWTISFGSIAVD